MIDSLLDVTVFTRVVSAGSLSAAARELGMSLAVVSKRLARLEERLGVRLVNRTTRSLNLTEEGAEFHERCVRVLGEIDEAEEKVRSLRHGASGLLKVTATAAFARRHLGRLIPRFLERYPDIRVQLDVSDSVVGLVESGYDVAIREFLGGELRAAYRWDGMDRVENTASTRQAPPVPGRELKASRRHRSS
jgi:DNA-binding transcriptional LysR family regulator